MAQLTMQQAFDLASQHHRAGRRRDAEALYRQILAFYPEHFGALIGLAQLAYAAGEPAGAVELLTRAARLAPQGADALRKLAAEMMNSSQLDQAIDSYRKLLSLLPNDAEACCNLGRALSQKGAMDEAITCCRRAAALRPEVPETHYGLGGTLRAAGRLEEALAAYRRALAMRPNYPVALCEVAEVLRQLGRFDQGLAAAERAVALGQNQSESHNVLAIILRELHKPQESEAACRRAIALKPDSADAHVNLGLALQEQGKLPEAEQMFRRAIKLRPELVDAHNNLGIVLWEQGRPDEASPAYEAALRLNPHDLKARFNLGLLQLAKGDFERGWENHEARFAANPQLIVARFEQPMWDGSDPGRRILVHCEQGFGDTFQFIRYVPLLADRGAEVIVRCPPELRRLLESQSGMGKVVTNGDTIPKFDFHVPLMSLPRLFGTTVSTIPAAVPYLTAGPQQVEQWRRRLEAEPGRLKVGLVWSGRPRRRADQARAIRPDLLLPLTEVPNVRWVSLQKEKTDATPDAFRVLDWTSELTDFADTAALISALDLVISVDTGVAHLAGALARPTWVLLQVPEWRWMLGREDSPWYPTMRLFRRPIPGDATSPIRRMAEALRTH